MRRTSASTSTGWVETQCYEVPIAIRIQREFIYCGNFIEEVLGSKPKNELTIPVEGRIHVPNSFSSHFQNLINIMLIIDPSNETLKSFKTSSVKQTRI